MRTHKTCFNIFPDWNREQEQADLDRRSAEGWHLIKPGRYFHKYEHDTSVRYRYQKDYQLGEPSMERYTETFTEQGWEYLSAAKGGHYFRKPYAPALPEEQYEIYTDEESLAELRKTQCFSTGIQAILFGIYFLVMAYCFFTKPMLLTLLPTLGCLFLLLERLLVLRFIRRPEKRKSPKANFLFTFCAVLLIASCFLGYCAVSLIRISISINNSAYTSRTYEAIPAGFDHGVALDTLDVPLFDNYFAYFHLKADSPACFTIADEYGKVVYTITTADYQNNKLPILLKKGRYTVYLSDFKGGEIDLDFHLH